MFFSRLFRLGGFTEKGSGWDSTFFSSLSLRDVLFWNPILRLYLLNAFLTRFLFCTYLQLRDWTRDFGRIFLGEKRSDFGGVMNILSFLLHEMCSFLVCVDVI